MAYEATLERVEAHPMAAVAARAKQEQLSRVIPTALDAVYAALRTTGDWGPLGHNVVLYGPGDDGVTLELAIGVRLERPFPGLGQVANAETPAGEAVHVVHFGEYSKMHPAHQAAQAAAGELGRRLTGASWEVYGDFTSDVTKLRTDIYYQVEPAPGELGDG
jgi:effector-binding domain-containing protein